MKYITMVAVLIGMVFTPLVAHAEETVTEAINVEQVVTEEVYKETLKGMSIEELESLNTKLKNVPVETVKDQQLKDLTEDVLKYRKEQRIEIKKGNRKVIIASLGTVSVLGALVIWANTDKTKNEDDE